MGEEGSEDEVVGRKRNGRSVYEDEESVHTRRESKNGKYKEVASDEEEEDLEEEATPKRVKPARSSKKKPAVIDSEEDNGQNGHADTNENGVEEIDGSDEDIPLV